MVHGSWFMVHGSWFMVHGSWFMVDKNKGTKGTSDFSQLTLNPLNG
jgi:hypothetical protein